MLVQRDAGAVRGRCSLSPSPLPSPPRGRGCKRGALAVVLVPSPPWGRGLGRGGARYWHCANDLPVEPITHQSRSAKCLRPPHSPCLCMISFRPTPNSFAHSIRGQGAGGTPLNVRMNAHLHNSNALPNLQPRASCPGTQRSSPVWRACLPGPWPRPCRDRRFLSARTNAICRAHRDKRPIPPSPLPAA